MQAVLIAASAIVVAILIGALVFYICWQYGGLRIRASLTTSVLIGTIILLFMLPLFSFLNTESMMMIMVFYGMILLITLAVVLSYLAIRIAEDRRHVY